MKKVTYKSPEVEVLEMQQAQVCCGSFEDYGNNGDKIETDTEYDW